MKSRSTRYSIASRTSGIANGLRRPSGAGAGLSTSDSAVAGAWNVCTDGSSWSCWAASVRSP